MHSNFILDSVLVRHMVFVGNVQKSLNISFHLKGLNSSVDF